MHRRQVFCAQRQTGFNPPQHGPLQHVIPTQEMMRHKLRMRGIADIVDDGKACLAETWAREWRVHDANRRSWRRRRRRARLTQERATTTTLEQHCSRGRRETPVQRLSSSFRGEGLREKTQSDSRGGNCDSDKAAVSLSVSFSRRRPLSLSLCLSLGSATRNG